MVICLQRGADLCMAQLKPLPLTISCCSKSRLVLPSWFYWPTVLSVMPLVQCLVCLSSVVCLSVCDVSYCGKTVRPSQKVSEGVNRKPGSKSSFFLVAAIFLLPVLPLRPPRWPFFASCIVAKRCVLSKKCLKE